jgi:hypothetical protein
MNLPVVVAFLFEDIPQENQLSLQAAFVTKSSGFVYQSGQYWLFIGWVMKGLGVEVEIGVCVNEFAVYFVFQTAIRSSVNIQIQEWEVAFTFGFRGEMNGLMDAV